MVLRRHLQTQLPYVRNLQMRLSLSLFLLFFCSCGPNETSSFIADNESVSKFLKISPSPTRVNVGDTQQLLARIVNHDGAQELASHVTWQSLSPEIASISEDGTVVALANGTAEIVGSIG